MAQFIAFEPNVEVNGETVLAIVDGMEAFAGRARQILAQCGIVDAKPGGWYRQQSWLDAFRIIAKTVGPKTLFLIGTRIPENANFPPQIDSIDKALAAIDVAYHMNHRGGEIGTYGYKSTSSNSATMVCKNPYPCDFDRGIIEAMAKRFKPKGSLIVRVSHDDAAGCRKEGGDSCTYRVTW
jgi:hypothetical protein